MKLSYAFILVLLVLLVSCAHQAPVTKMTYTHPQLEAKKVSTGMPNLFLDKDILASMKTTKAGRAPASAQEWEKSLESDKKEGSLKELYFKSLYSQYLKWQRLSQDLAPVNSCPAFHHHKLILDETQDQTVTGLKIETELPKTEQDLPYYPVWALGLKKNGVEKLAYEWSTVNGENQTEILDQAVKSHGKKVFKEITTLCEDGSSDSYFRLENMATYFASKTSFTQNSDSLKAYLKIPVFANMLLLHSLTVESKVNFHTAEVSLLDKVQGWQIESYILELKKHKLSKHHALVR